MGDTKRLLAQRPRRVQRIVAHQLHALRGIHPKAAGFILAHHRQHARKLIRVSRRRVLEDRRVAVAQHIHAVALFVAVAPEHPAQMALRHADNQHAKRLVIERAVIHRARHGDILLPLVDQKRGRKQVPDQMPLAILRLNDPAFLPEIAVILKISAPVGIAAPCAIKQGHQHVAIRVQIVHLCIVDAFVEQLVNRIVRVCRVAQPLQQRAVGDNGAGNSRHVAKAVVDSFLGLGDTADDLLAELLLDIGLVLNPDPAKHEEQGQDEAQQKRQIRSK